jgi:hypothetical protein
MRAFAAPTARVLAGKIRSPQPEIRKATPETNPVLVSGFGRMPSDFWFWISELAPTAPSLHLQNLA